MVHPETGEILETREQFLEALKMVEESMEPYWKVRRILREGFAERFPAMLPARVNRTEKQERIARCPRCGEKLS